MRHHGITRRSPEGGCFCDPVETLQPSRQRRNGSSLESLEGVDLLGDLGIEVVVFGCKTRDTCREFVAVAGLVGQY